MKIWVIGRSYPMELNNMQGSFELEQAKMLGKYGNDVAYLACVFHPFKKIKKWGFCGWQEDGISVYTNSQFYAHERMKLHLERFQTWVWKKFLEKVEATTGIPDVIHIHYPANISIVELMLSYQEKGTRIICTEHWTQVLTGVIDSYERRRLKMYADHADAFLCVGPPLKKAVREITGTKKEIFVVPNIANNLFQPQAVRDGVFRFVAVGGMRPVKQFDKIIVSFSKCFKGKEGVMLRIVGGGVEEQDLMGLVDKLGIKDQVEFTGKLYREQVAEKVASSDALVCYSRLETFGVPIIEAWACGIPVIATTAAAVCEEWDRKLGFQIPPDDEEELQGKMMDLFTHIKDYDSQYIREYAMEHFSERKVYEMLLGFYQ